MEIRRLGEAGLAVSTLGLGTLTWGRDTSEVEAAEMLAAYLSAGGTTLDVPSDWGSQTFAGRVATVGATLRGGRRGALVLVLHSGNLPEPSSAPDLFDRLGPRTSRRNLLASLDSALQDLGTDHVDLWVLHGPRDGVSIEEMRGAAEFAVASGRARYVGAAGLGAWDLGSLVGAPPTVSPQFAALAAPLSLVDAAAKNTVLAHGHAAGLGFLALAPLAQGVLTGKYRHSTPPDSRAATAHLASLVAPYLTARHARVVEAAARAAAGLEVGTPQVALAWVLAQPGVSSAIVGPRNTRQLEALLSDGPLRLQRELQEVLSEVALT